MNEDQILDSTEEKGASIYARKSLNNLLYSIASLVVIFLTSALFFRSNKGNVFLDIGVYILMAVVLICTIKGIIQGFKSIRNRERSLWKKYIGTFGNFIIFLSYGSILLANLYDISKYMNI